MIRKFWYYKQGSAQHATGRCGVAESAMRTAQHATHFSEKPPQRIFHAATRNVAVLRRCGFHIYNSHLLQNFIDK